MKKINILHIITSLGKGGAETMLYNLLSKCDRDKFHHTVISLTRGGFYKNEIIKLGIKVFDYDLSKIINIFSFLLKIFQIKKTFHFDIIQSWMYHSNIISFIFSFFYHKAEIFWAIHHSLHDFFNRPFSSRFIIKSNAFLSLSKRISKIIYVSNKSSIQHLALGFHKDKTIVIPNGFDINLFSPDNNVKTDEKIKLGLQNDELLIGVVGRFNPFKDHANFLKAIKVLKSKANHIKWKCLLIGRGINRENIELMSLIDSLGLADKIILRDETNLIHLIIKSLDILCLSSFSEAFPNVVGEAMSSGVPCVVTNVGDSSSIVGSTGIVVPSRNHIALAQGLFKLLDYSERERQALGFEARKRIIEYFSINNIIKLYENLYLSHYKIIRIRVLHIITSLGKGGAENMLFKLLGNYNKNQFTHEIVSLTKEGFYKNKIMQMGINVSDCDFSNVFTSFISFFKLIKILYRFSPNIIQAWMYHSNIAASYLKILFFFKHIHVIWNIRHSLSEYYHERYATRFIIWLNRHSSFLAHKIIYNSELSAIQHENYGFLKSKTYLIPNGFDIHTFSPDIDTGNIFRSKNDIPLDCILIGVIGRYDTLKNYPNFIYAVSILKPRIRDIQWKCILVGRDVNKNNLKLTTLLNELNLTDKIQLFGEVDNVTDVLKSLDILCLCSSSESFPNVVGEAMSTAIPCVVTDVGDTSKIIGNTGILVPSKDSPALSLGLEKLIRTDKYSRIKLGNEARDRIISKYSIDKINMMYENMYYVTFESKL